MSVREEAREKAWHQWRRGEDAFTLTPVNAFHAGYDAGRSAREWRRVKDGLPTEEGTYWVTSREKLVYRCEFYFTNHDRNYWLEYIVAWQPETPPEPYTEEERA